MKKMNAENIKNVVKMHPASTAMAFLYTIIFIVQGNTEVFLAGIAAASGACILEFLFLATGAIRVRRGRVRIARSVPAAKQSSRVNAGQPVRKGNEIRAAKLKVTRIRQKTAA